MLKSVYVTVSWELHELFPDNDSVSSLNSEHNWAIDPLRASNEGLCGGFRHVAERQEPPILAIFNRPDGVLGMTKD